MITGDSYIGSNRQHRLSDQVSANTVQVGSFRPAFSQHARRRSQHLQPATPSRLARDAADLPSRGSEPMAACGCSRVIAQLVVDSFCSLEVKLTMPARRMRAWRHPFIPVLTVEFEPG